MRRYKEKIKSKRKVNANSVVQLCDQVSQKSRVLQIVYAWYQKKVRVELVVNE